MRSVSAEEWNRIFGERRPEQIRYRIVELAPLRGVRVYAVLSPSSGRPVTLVVGGHSYAAETLDDLAIAVAQIATLPDIRPAITEFKALAERVARGEQV